MRIERALKLRDAARRRVRDAYDLAARVGLPSADINETVGAIRAELNAAKAPGWVGAYLDGYTQALRDAQNAEPGLIVYGGWLPSGAFVSVNRGRPDYYERLGIEPAAFAMKSASGEIERLGLYWGRFNPPRVHFISDESAAADASR